ncbi:MAG: substrate-binding domain-containing protein [Fibrobacterota bacterium]|nr:MAG: substrate-binding domain-containing protein [Fibrobacterota bacterium]
MANATELADRFLELLPTWPAGKLPGLRELAVTHHASTKTVQAALDRMREAGWIESRPRSGLWRKGELPQGEAIARKETAQDIGARLCQEIREGLHAWGEPLRSVKELAIAWKCHVQTVKKALEVPLGEGLLERVGRAHIPIRPRSRSLGKSPILVCVGATSAEGGFRMDTDRESDFWRELGIQAAQAGLASRRIPWSSGRLKLPASTVGVVAATWHLHDPEKMCQELTKLDVPVCLWMEDCSLVSKGKRFPKLFVHDQGYGSIIGSQLAAHLLALGHRHLAYVSPWHASRWSQNRLQGMQKEAALHDGRVESFHLEGESDWDRLGPAWTDPVLMKRFPEGLLSRLVEGSAEPFRTMAIHHLGWNRIRSDLAPVFEKALASKATAWVVANDLCACFALRWLRERGVDVPGKVSVAGFDDTLDALRNDLTSYRFSTTAMAREMIYQILSPHAIRKISHHAGIVVERGSTRRL